MTQTEGKTKVMTEEEVETCVLDKRGDLWIRTRHHGDKAPACNFLVDSKTLSRHSKVFDSMLYSDFIESKQESDAEPRWTVELPEDLSTPLKWLFSVMHGEFRSAQLFVFPPPDATHTIFQLAIAADKYDCIQLFRPWVGGWRTALEPTATTDYARLCELAWTTYTIGDRRLYETAMTRLTIQYMEDAARDSALHSPLKGMTVSLRENVLLARRELYDTMLQKVRQPLDILINKPDEAKYCRFIKKREPSPLFSTPGKTTTKDNKNNDNKETKDKDNKDCESRLLGRLVQELAQAQLWPLPTADEITMSPQELGRKLDNLCPPPSGLVFPPNGLMFPLASHAHCEIFSVASAAFAANSSTRKTEEFLFSFSGLAVSNSVTFKYKCSAHEITCLKTQAGRTGALHI